MGILSFLIAAAALTLGYLRRNDAYALEVSVSVAAFAFTNMVDRIAILQRGFVRPVLMASTFLRRSSIRVSIAYLFSIQVDDRYLLVRGQRITTQFQPVGGVFKTYLSDSDLERRFKARPDGRFVVDDRSRRDLRVRLPGRNLHKLIRWFRSRKDRELFPHREFFEELVASKILSPDTFPYLDCEYVGTKRSPLKFDKYSQCKQLIIGEVYRLILSEKQTVALRELRDRLPDNASSVYFASREEIRHGGATMTAQTSFDIAPTAAWLTE